MIPFIVGTVAGLNVVFKDKKPLNNENNNELSKKTRVRKYNLTLFEEDLLLVDIFSKLKNSTWNRSEFLEEAMRRSLLEGIKNQQGVMFLSVKADQILKKGNYDFDIPWTYQVFKEKIDSLLSEESKVVINSVQNIKGAATAAGIGSAAGRGVIAPWLIPVIGAAAITSHIKKSMSEGKGSTNFIDGLENKEQENMFSNAELENSESMESIWNEDVDKLFENIVIGGWKQQTNTDIKNNLTTKTVGLRPKDSTFALMDVITKWSGKPSTLSNIYQMNLSNMIEDMILSYSGTDFYKEGIFLTLQHVLEDKKYIPNEATVLGRLFRDEKIIINNETKEIEIFD